MMVTRACSLVVVLLLPQNSRSTSLLHDGTPDVTLSQSHGPELKGGSNMSEPNGIERPMTAPSRFQGVTSLSSRQLDEDARAPTQMPTFAPSPFLSVPPSSWPARIQLPGLTIMNEDAASPFTDSEPSTWPSDVPSMTPTTAPNTLPSAAPSLECHDLVSYASPINNLTCVDHADTDCLEWRHLGLDKNELQALVESCPESCRVPCSSTWWSFVLVVEIRVFNVPGFMDEVTKRDMEEASQWFLQDYAQGQSDRVVELDRVELTSQSLVKSGSAGRPTSSGNDNHNRSLVNGHFHQRRQRETNERATTKEANDEVLDISLLFDGFSIDLAPDEVSELLLLGIDKPEYTKHLQRYSDFFAVATASSTAEAPPIETSMDGGSDSDDSAASRATLIVSFLVPLLILAFVIGSLVYHRRASGRWVPFPGGTKSHRIETQIGGGTAVNINPPSFDAYHNNQGSNEDSGHDPVNVGLFGSLIASWSQRSSRTTTSRESSSREDGTIVKITTDHSHVNSRKDGDETAIEAVILDTSEWSGNGYGKASAPHGVLPMVVIDIDDNDADEIVFDNHQQAANPRATTSGAATVASRRAMELEVLSWESRNALKQGDPNGADNNYSTHMLRDTHWQGSKHSQSPSLSNGKKSSKFDYNSRVESESEEENTSVASTPVNSKTPRARPQVRRTSSFSTVDDLDMKNLGLLPLSTEDANGRFVGQQISDTSLNEVRRFVETWPITSPGNGSPSIQTIPSPLVHLPPASASSPRTADSINIRGRRPPMRPPTPERRRRHTRTLSPSTNKHFCSGPLSMPSLTVSPITRAFKESTDTFKGSMLPHISGHTRQLSSASDLSDDFGSVVPSSHSAYSDSSIIQGQTQRFNLEAPRRGQLGLVIESNSKTGPLIYAVKDYSPLFGQIQPGDKIVEINGKDTSQYNLVELTKLLKAKKSSSFMMGGGGGSGGSDRDKLRLVVSRARAVKKDGASFHHRGSSYGSETSSLAKSRILEDLDESDHEQQIHERMSSVV